MNIFDILGPVMVGPSSSHTAGAARIGKIARSILGQTPRTAELLLHGSFASTGEGHGTKQALIAGLLGMDPDDARIPDSFAWAERERLRFSFGTCELRDAHPNSVLLRLESEDGRQTEIGASSLGGGRIRVFQVDGLRTSFSGELPTLLICNRDKPGCVTHVTSLLSDAVLNVATLQLSRGGRGGSAMMVIECDQPIPEELVRRLHTVPDVLRATCVQMEAPL